MDNLRTWWQGLASREQQLVGFGGVFLVVGVLYWGVWAPIAQAEADALRNLSAQQQTLNYVKQTANKIAGLKQAGAKPSASGSLSSVVNQTAGNYGLVITRMQPQGDNCLLYTSPSPRD